VDVATLRTYVRNHLEVDDEELPDVLLNPYLQDAFERTVALDNRWPRNEATWGLVKVLGNYVIDLPPDMLAPSIISVTAHATNRRLTYITQENAEDLFTQNEVVAIGDPVYWSTWGRQMTLWPSPGPDVSFDVGVRGYRQPLWDEAASTIPDIDPRLHPALAYYAMALTYAAQEDEILEGVYMARWDRDAKAFMGAIMDPPRHRPLVLNGGPAVLGGSSYYIVPPGPSRTSITWSTSSPAA
jgi:hypothetical protein